MRYIFILYHLLFFNFQLAAQQNIRFERIGTREGLSNQKVNCIFQDSKGFIWIGTDFGLNRFDGISCKSWYHNEKDSNSLVHNTVLSIKEDASNNLWIGTQEGVSCFNSTTGIFTNYSTDKKGTRHFSKENCFTFVDKTNKIWVGSNSGISWLNTSTGKFQDIAVELTRPGIRRNLFATSFLHDSKNRLWVSTSYGVKRIDIEKGTTTSYHNPEPPDRKLELNACTQMAEDRKGRIFVGTWNAGLLFFDEQLKQFIHRSVSDITAQNVIFSILPIVENKIDYLWLGTGFGLLKIKTDDLFIPSNKIENTTYIPEKLNTESISNEMVSSIIKDRSGNKWIGTYSGVNKIDPLQQQFQIAYFNIDKKQPQEINAAAESFVSTDELYISSPKQIFRFNKTTGNIVNINSAIKDITTIHKGKKYFWVGSFHGLWQCDESMNMVKKWFTTGFKTETGAAKIKSVLEDRAGNTWCGLWRGGILKINFQTRSIEKFLMDSSREYNLSNYIINKIIEDSKGNIWFASNNGLYHWRFSENRFYRYRVNNNSLEALADAIESIRETKDGKIWIGSRQGLRYYDYASDKMIPVDFGNESINNFISAVEEDANGMLWLATVNGLLQYNPGKKEIKQFNTATGLQNNDLTNLFYKTESGEILIGSAGAVTFFTPSAITKNPVTFPPVFTNIFIDNKSIPVNYLSTINIKYNQSINFDFVALNYSNASANQYAYRLTGIDNDWKQLGGNRNLRFANLSPGSYELKIKAANSDAVWNENPVSLNFIVSPPFWKTWWFISLIVLVIALTAYAFYRNRLQRAVEMERLRTRIATDLHDDIGATLSSISMYSEAVKEQVKEKLPQLQPVLDKMGENSRSMVSSMSDIVWAINPDNDEGQKLLQRMEAYAKDNSAVKNVTLNFSADKKINDIKLPLEHRKNIYLLFKESLNNALKYSEADTIDVNLKLLGNRLYLSVCDNGKGFDLKNGKTGNGLKNMEIRAAEIGGTVIIESMEENGTKVFLECSIT